jgi:hypothetical protein
MGSRSGNQDGSCCLLESGKDAGKWRVQHTLEDEFGRKSRISRTFPTKTAAKDSQRDLRRGIRIEEVQSRRLLMLGSWFDWLLENDWPESLAATTAAERKGCFGQVRPEGVERRRPGETGSGPLRLAVRGA